MPLSFQQRIFAVLAALTAVPTILAVIGWALAARVGAPSAGARASLEQVASSARLLLERVDTVRLSPPERAAVRNHLAEISNSLTLARRAETYFRYYAGGFVAVIVDFEALRQALRELAGALDVVRDQELEAERLRAFREVARRVAHEIKNPLTSMRIAVEQLQRSLERGAEPRIAMAAEVLSAETDRLDRLAREFAEFGRLPEGPRSEVDLVELLQEQGRTAVPDGVQVTVDANGGRPMLVAHYDPLRRAFANLLRNASEAMGGQGRIDIAVTGGEGGTGDGVVVTIADHGPGIPEEPRARVFEPYLTTKADGTGLGLALVRQTLETHRCTIRAEETPGGGATFILVFPR